MISPYIPQDPCGLALVGEAPGEQEEKVGLPFVGTSGQELRSIMTEAGLDMGRCLLTNVFMERPPNNELDKWQLGAREYKMAVARMAAESGVPSETICPGAAQICPVVTKPMSRGAHCHPQHAHHVVNLMRFLTEHSPTLIVALGGTATWALLGTGAISSIRGTVAPNQLCGGKVLSTFHPAYVLRQWSDRPVMVADFIKAKKELEFPEVRRPQRTVEVAQSEADFMLFEQSLCFAQILSIDIETSHGQITCIGFSHSPRRAFVVPFVEFPNKSYWPTAEFEVMALEYIRRWLGMATPKLFQNGMYDIHWLWRQWGMKVRNAQHDTMLRHHSLQPELKKSLGFLGSLYTCEMPWKIMRKRKADTEKRDE